MKTILIIIGLLLCLPNVNLAADDPANRKKSWLNFNMVVFGLGKQSGLDLSSYQFGIPLGAKHRLSYTGMQTTKQGPSTLWSNTDYGSEHAETSNGIKYRYFFRKKFNIKFMYKNHKLQGTIHDNDGFGNYGPAIANYSINFTHTSVSLGNEWNYDNGFCMGWDWFELHQYKNWQETSSGSAAALYALRQELTIPQSGPKFYIGYSF